MSKKFLIFFACVLSISLPWNHLFVSNRIFSAIPAALNVNNIIYKNEDYFGAGIAVYELPSKTKEKIQTHGLEYLNTTYNINSPYNDDGVFRNWKATPIPISDAWTGPTMGGVPEYKTDVPQISNYLSRYNLGLSLEQHIESKIDRIMQSSGSYFAYQNVRMIIVSPSEEIVVYAYSR